MALTIRLQRHGTKGAPVYRMVVCEKTIRRDGRFVEILGIYNPKPRGRDVPYNLKLDRVDYWLKIGALPSDTAWSLIKRARKGYVAAPVSAAPAAPAAAAVAPAEAATPVA
jgi:small subunit ribosomal protein S16